MLGPDLVLLNGKVITMSPGNRIAEAVAMYGGRIVGVGSTESMKDLATRSTRVIDLGGRTVLPGLTDPHVHLADFGTEDLNTLDCRDFHTNIRTLEHVLEQIEVHARRIPKGEWIRAQGSPMQDFRMPEGRFPDRSDLDRTVPDHPVVIAFGAHVAIANSKAMAELGVDENTKPPAGGRMERDEASGLLTGRFFERAQYLVRRPIGDFPLEKKKLGILDAAAKCLQRGVTTIHDIAQDPITVSAYQELCAEGRLPLRVSLLIRVIESKIGPESLLQLGLKNGFGNDWFKLGGVKISIDGGATGHQAAFSEGYPDDRCNCGLIRIPSDELEDVTGRYHNAGHRICIHAMGDVAMDMSLSALEKAIVARPRDDHRHRIEHMGNWMVTPARMETMRRLGIIPVPNIAFGHYLHDSLSSMLGADRMTEFMNFKSMIDAGLPITSGSDGPSYWAVDILRDIGIAVTRRTRTGERFLTSEALTREQALRLMTTNAAFSGFEEKIKGSIEVGRLADVIVLEEDIMTIDADRIKDMRVDLTIVDGKIAYSRH